MPVKVTVVVPVYNPGRYLEKCISSLARQSLPKQEYEVIWVDDGSTDGTAARLDVLPVAYPNMRVLHEPNSGWSGRPRNVGIDAARGEFVMFVDNDDWLADRALERMYDYGVANDADVVIGKMAGKGRPVPLELFRVNRPRTDLETAPLMDSLTPHKMFRKDFLDRHHLRFPEGRRRLEDHVFVTEAYLRAGNVSVLGDEVCYYHIKRKDASNAGFQQFDPAGYYGNLRDSLDVVERLTEPGPLRDRMLRRWLRGEMLERVRGSRLLAVPEGDREELFAEVRRLYLERFPASVVEGLPPMHQAAAALLAAGLFGDLEELGRWEAQIRAAATLHDLRYQRGRLVMDLEAELVTGKGPMTFRRGGATVHIDPVVPRGTREALERLAPPITADVDASRLDVVLRKRASAAEFYLPVDVQRQRLAVPHGPGAFRSVLRGRATVDVQKAAGGAPLALGIWDVLVRVSSSGWTRETRLGAVRSPGVESLPVLVDEEGAVHRVYDTDKGNVSLSIRAPRSRLDEALAAATITESSGRLLVDLGVVWQRPPTAELALTPEQGTPEKGTPEQATPEKGTPEKGTPEKGTPEATVTWQLRRARRDRAVWVATATRQRLRMRPGTYRARLTLSGEPGVVEGDQVYELDQAFELDQETRRRWQWLAARTFTRRVARRALRSLHR